MTFKLYALTEHGYKETSFDQLDNKAFWCSHGERQEVAFVKVMKGIPSSYEVLIHPQKESNPFHPDLLVLSSQSKVQKVGEVKIKNSPLFYGNRYGISPQFALTMDLKDSFNYLSWLKKGIDISIFIWVKWEAHRMISGGKQYDVAPMSGVWVTEFSKLRKLEEESPPPIHWYNSDFRMPPIYYKDQEAKWCEKLVLFDQRLRDHHGNTKNITSKGYMRLDSGEFVPTGHSSGSYVFNLKDKSVFEELYLKTG